jgi:transposase
LPGMEDIAWLGGWEGYEVCGVDRREGPVAEIWIYLMPRPVGAMICEGCGAATSELHELTYRQVRDLPILDARTWVLVPRRRVHCRSCGPKLERLSWLAPYARVTRRLADSVARLCAVLPVKQVAQFFGLGWDAVKAIDKRHLAERLGPIDLCGITTIAMDEFAIQKGHRYATVIVEPARKRVLWVGRGRSREAVRPFFELLGQTGCAGLKAVAMDMNAAYELEVRKHCPSAEVVYDLFHVIAKYGREVIDRVRVDEANRLKHDRPARRLVKSARWLLLRNRDTISKDEDRVKLDELLAANQALMTVYVLKDDLKQLWHHRQRDEAEQAWQDWFRRALDSAIKPLQAFARRLRTYLPGILAHATWPLHTSLLEGINNKIKVIKRMAYGFRDDAYFFLKIRAAFPGNPG